MGGSSVFVGVWQNYLKSGYTITLEESQGDILQNVLALLVQSAGQSVWTIISYIIHQARNNRPPDHPIFYQQQGVLRNSGSALTAALRLGQLSLNWRGRPGLSATHYRFRSTLYYIFVALMVSVGFSLASVFSSLVTKYASHEVLLRPNNCGFSATRNYTIVKNAKRALLTDAWSAMYANTCYKNDSNPLCGTYVVRKIESVDEIAPCPFPEGVCVESAWSSDTGLQDTAKILGVNAEPSERLFFRKKATCAPLKLGKYTTKFTKYFHEAGPSSLFVNETVQQYYLGQRGAEVLKNDNNETNGKNNNKKDPGKTPKFNSSDLTYEYFTANVFTSPGYQLQALHSEVGEGRPRRPDWRPVPDFKRSDADTVVFLLSSSGVKYRNSIFDPFFKAVNSSKTNNISFDGEVPKTQVFRPADLVTGIGCIDQYQICNPNLPRGLKNCTSLASAADVSKMTDSLNLTPLQNATALILNHYLQDSGIYNTVSSQGESALKAHSTSFSIQNDVVQVGNKTELKWQNEVEYWFAASLAGLQIKFVQTVGDKSGKDSSHGFQHGNNQKNRKNDNSGKEQQALARKENFVSLNQNPSQEAICASQLIHIMDGYQNFSLIGVILIVVLSVMLVILSLYIHVVGKKIQKTLFGNPFSRVSWTSDGYLQIQRMAYEGAGYEGWEQCGTDDVPVSRDIEKLAGLDISDINHPRLLKVVGATKNGGVVNSKDPTLSRSSTLTSKSKDLPSLPMSDEIFSGTVLDTRNSHHGGQAQRREEERRAMGHTATLTSLSGMTSVDYYRPLPPLPLR